MTKEKVFVAVKNPNAKELNRQPWYLIREYVVDHYTEKAVVLKCGKIFPKERCFRTYEECEKSIGKEMLEKRAWG